MPKVHKDGYPLRIIISSTGSPLHNLATFLYKILVTSLPPVKGFIRNSFQLAKNIDKLKISNDDTLFSLDVVSLFTNVPVDLVLDGINKRWHLIRTNTCLSRTEFLNATKLILDSTFFTFNDKYYRQSFGVPMSSPLSPVLADIVLQDLETFTFFNRLTKEPSFYIRYVDDIALAINKTHINELCLTFNNYHPRLKFTLEEGGDKLNFLDLTLIKKNDSIYHDWYQKPTSSGRYLNFCLQHPLCQKIGVIVSLTDRVLLLSHPSFHRKNLDKIIRILLNNGYPLNLIFSTINKRLHKKFSNHNNQIANNKKVEKKQIYFTVPFIAGISERIKNLLKKTNIIKIAYKGINKLSNYIRVQKDKLPHFMHTDVVYKVECRDCDASYIGQTGRTLKIRISECFGFILVSKFAPVYMSLSAVEQVGDWRYQVAL
ncbi:uncharacterized protein [Mycetomoellerius zeteki]|uniref:uncharacterized protein n=1 Tax=Mycetomoellerius zeteki TaxID=64791 RepID=UPI00084E9AA4|nr:PREDICTED: uncharacterized protein LOC108724530 [Trachymyrmex zeteki]